MRTSRLSETQIVSILRQADAAATVQDICRQNGISNATSRKREVAALENVREATYWWMMEYNEEHPPTSPGNLTPSKPVRDSQKTLLSHCVFDGEACDGVRGDNLHGDSG